VLKVSAKTLFSASGNPVGEQQTWYARSTSRPVESDRIYCKAKVISNFVSSGRFLAVAI
jgi:hypothetical protein